MGDLEILYTMRDVTDAELTSRVQHLMPWVQDLLDQARERQAHLDLLRQQREATSAGQTAGPQPPSPTPPADLQALIQQAVQQALAAQQPPSIGQAPCARPQPGPTRRHAPPASPADWCPLHQVAMEQRSNAKGTWYSHWLASEQRYCKGKRNGAPRAEDPPSPLHPESKETNDDAPHGSLSVQSLLGHLG